MLLCCVVFNFQNEWRKLKQELVHRANERPSKRERDGKKEGKIKEQIVFGVPLVMMYLNGSTATNIATERQQ